MGVIEEDRHLRGGVAPAVRKQLPVFFRCEDAQQFLQRRFYVDQTAVDAAKSEIVQRTRTARDVYAAAILVADLPDNYEFRCRLREHARQSLAETYEAIDMDEYSIVINAAITAACLLKLGHLFANREEVVTGTSVVQAAETIGRGLDVPTDGLEALSKQGFRFTEDQKKLAEAMESTGDIAGAQGIILKALEESYGGAATAARDTFGGSFDALRNTIAGLLTARAVSAAPPLVTPVPTASPMVGTPGMVGSLSQKGLFTAAKW